MHLHQHRTAICKRVFSRRSFLKTGLLTATGLALPVTSLARVAEAADNLWPEKTLSFYNTHTGEKLSSGVYWADGAYIPETLERINYILRDHRSDVVEPIDHDLLDLLHTLSRRLGSTRPFHVISGFRSPATNKLLRRQTQGVARRSLHMSGKAIDVRVPGLDLHLLRKAAIAQNKGGVGYYPASNFVHLDTGRTRYW